MVAIEWISAFSPIIAVILASLLSILLIEVYNRKKEKILMKVNLIEELSLIVKMGNHLRLMFESSNNPLEMEIECTEYLSELYVLFHKMRAYLGIKDEYLSAIGINIEEIKDHLELMTGIEEKPKILYNVYKSVGNLFELIHEV